MLRSISVKFAPRTCEGFTSGFIPGTPSLWGSYTHGGVVAERTGNNNTRQSAVSYSSCCTKGETKQYSEFSEVGHHKFATFPLLASSAPGFYQTNSTLDTSQTKRWTSTTPETPGSAGDEEVEPLPSPHFKTRKNLEVGKEEKKSETIQAKTDEHPGSHNYLLPHPIWSETELDSIEVTHRPPDDRVDKAAFYSCKALRKGFDIFSGFTWGKRTEKKWIYRIIFLETVAGVPGMVAGMCRHLRSLRRMQRDYGWIHTLLEEAENERMHLMTALEIKQPSLFFRLMVLGAQGVFVNVFFVSYLISPRFCHRFVGYLEEEAVVTYTKLLKDLKNGALPKWQDRRAPEISINYWKMRPDADFVDLFRAIRADEAHHREVNHKLGDIKPDQPNPYGPGR